MNIRTETKLAANLTAISGFYLGIELPGIFAEMKEDLARRYADTHKDKHFVLAESPYTPGRHFLVEIPHPHFREFFHGAEDIANNLEGAIFIDNILVDGVAHIK